MTMQPEPADHPPDGRFPVYAPQQMQAPADRMAEQAMPLLGGRDMTPIVVLLRRGAP